MEKYDEFLEQFAAWIPFEEECENYKQEFLNQYFPHLPTAVKARIKKKVYEKLIPLVVPFGLVNLPYSHQFAYLQELEEALHPSYPQTKKALIYFLGRVGYYKTFIPNHKSLVTPLEEVLSDDTFEFSMGCKLCYCLLLASLNGLGMG